MTELPDRIGAYCDEHDELCTTMEDLNETLPADATVVSVEPTPTSGDEVGIEIAFDGLADAVGEAFDGFEVGGGSPTVSVYLPSDES